MTVDKETSFMFIPKVKHLNFIPLMKNPIRPERGVVWVDGE